PTRKRVLAPLLRWMPTAIGNINSPFKPVTNWWVIILRFWLQQVRERRLDSSSHCMYTYDPVTQDGGTLIKNFSSLVIQGDSGQANVPWNEISYLFSTGGTFEIYAEAASQGIGPSTSSSAAFGLDNFYLERQIRPTIDSLIRAVNEAVANGTLTGTGPGR